MTDTEQQRDEREGPQLHGWLQPPVVAVALVVLGAGFGQFGAVAALADVAEDFGAVVDGDDLTIAEQAGLSGTQIGIGLAIIRLASLGALPLAGVADRAGRRATVIGLGALGLLIVVLSSLSPSYWWFVAIFALSRPLLTATDAIGEVSAAEHTASSDRAKAIALVAAGYGIGSGLVAVVRGVGGDALGWRPLFVLALVPLVLVVVAGRHVTEPDRYRVAAARKDKPLPVLGAVGPRFRRDVAILAALVFAVSLVTGPANSFLFFYAEGILDLSPMVTASLVVGAGGTGLVGLLVGRWGADRLGRRLTGALALVGVALAGIVTYSGPAVAAGAGYLLAVLAGSVFAPAVGAMHAELFPTSVRATVAGWLLAAGVLGAVVGLFSFGAIADVEDRFDLAALAVFVPAAVVSGLFTLLPETKGKELEESAPEE
jgi:MFS family permease